MSATEIAELKSARWQQALDAALDKTGKCLRDAQNSAKGAEWKIAIAGRQTIRDPLPDGLYAAVGAEHFTNPGYDDYRRYVEKFDLPVLPWARRQNMYRRIDGRWFTEEQLADKSVLAGFGFNAREIDHIRAHGWRELPMLYLAPYVARFKDEYQPFGIGLDEFDHLLLGEVLADSGISPAAARFIGAAARRKPN